MLDRANRPLIDLINRQLARPTGRQGAEAFRPLGWMIRGIDMWEANRPAALADLRANARQGILELYEFLVAQPVTFSCSPEEFVLGYQPVLVASVPKEQQMKLETWYRCLGTVFAWLDVPQGDDLTDATCDRFRQEVGAAITELAGPLVSAQEAWGRIRARLG